METTDDSRQPLDAAGTKAPLVLESVSTSSLLDEVIRRIANRDDLERRAIKAERERDEARAASEQLAQWWIDQFAKATGWPATSSPHDPMLVKARAEALVKQRDDWMCAADAFESEAFRARAEVAAEKRVREQVTGERAVVFGDVKALRAVVQGVECKLADNIDSVAEASFVLRDLASSLLAFTGGGVSLAAAFKAVADLRRERDEANARIKELEHQVLARMEAERDEAISAAARLFKQGEAAKNLAAAVRALLDLENT
jgi:hypothetical protein